MKITVVGASGRIGSKVVEILRSEDHDVIASSRSSGVDVLTGAGLTDALTGAQVVVDVLNPPDLSGPAALEFFTTSTPNVIAAAKAARVGHYVALSIVGADGLPESGYMRAKVAQEMAIRESGIPYTIVRATQFLEFADAIVDSMTDGTEVRVPDALIQPIPAADVSAAVARAAMSEPANGIVNVGGPEKITFEQLAHDVLARKDADGVTITVDPTARYFGTPLEKGSLVTPD